MAFHGIEHVGARYAQHRCVVPGGIGDKVVQGLVAGADMPRVDPCGDRLHAFALARQAKSRHVGSHRFTAIGVAECTAQGPQIVLKTSLGGCRKGGHASMVSQEPRQRNKFMTQ